MAGLIFKSGCTLKDKHETYDIKMLNGLVIRDLSPSQITEGLRLGRYLPSDFICDAGGEWIPLRESGFYKNKRNKQTGWMVLFFISSILNILMLLLIFWQKARIEKLLN